MKSRERERTKKKSVNMFYFFAKRKGWSTKRDFRTPFFDDFFEGGKKTPFFRLV